MISYIRGELVALEEDKVIVDVGGVGYGIFMSGQAMGQLPPVGSKVKIHTYLNVKEDAMQLYGFLNRDALSVFKLLIGVSVIKVAVCRRGLPNALPRLRTYWITRWKRQMELMKIR